MATWTPLCFLLFLFSLSLAGCVNTGAEGEGVPEVRAGRFLYCTVKEGGGCGDGYRFGLELAEGELRALDPEGRPVSRFDPDSGVLFLQAFETEEPDFWPPVVWEALGPNLWDERIVGRLVLAMRAIQEPADWAYYENEVGSYTVATSRTQTTMVVEVNPETEDGAPAETRLTFDHPDGIWPPQRIHIESSHWEIDGIRYLRYEAEVGPPFFLDFGNLWNVGIEEAARVPELPPEFGFKHSLLRAVEDASRDPNVMTYMMAHPEWLLSSARIERGSIEEAYSLILVQDCDALYVVVEYSLGVLPYVVSKPEPGVCRQEGDGLDAIPTYRRASPESLLDLAERLGYDEPPAWMYYQAPDQEFLGPRTMDGHQTSHHAKWEAAYRERVEHRGESFDVDHVFTVSVPDSGSGFHSHEVRLVQGE